MLGATAGARRTSTTLERFREFSMSADVEIDTGDATPEQIRAFARRPSVGALAQLYQLTMVTPDGAFFPLAAAVDNRFGTVVDRPRLLEGRLPRNSAPFELAIGETLAKRLHVRVGGVATFDSYSKAQVAKAIATNGDPGPPNGPVVHFKVVGLVRRPLDLGVRGGPGGVVVPTPAFLARYRDKIGSFSTTIFRVCARRAASRASPRSSVTRGRRSGRTRASTC